MTEVPYIDFCFGSADGTLTRYEEGPSGVRSFTIKMSDVAACPIRSLSVEHYREDGVCEHVQQMDDETLRLRYNATELKPNAFGKELLHRVHARDRAEFGMSADNERLH